MVEYIGTKKIEKIKVLNNKTKEVTEMKMDGVFMAIGKLPTSEIFKDIHLPKNCLYFFVVYTSDYFLNTLPGQSMKRKMAITILIISMMPRLYQSVLICQLPSIFSLL